MGVFERLSIVVIFVVGLSLESRADGKLLILVNDSTTVESARASLCPRQYIDVLAECPGNLECTTDENCSQNDVCCSNACGSRTCVSPWIPQGHEDTAGNSACANHTCHGQGRECRAIEGRAWCVCITECDETTTNEDYICDQDGELYLSLCKLDKHACESGTTLEATRCRPVGDDSNVEARDVRPPRFISLPSVITAKERSQVTMECRSLGTPTPTIFWQTKDGGEVIAPGAESEGMSVSETGQFRINNAQRSDSGEYTCIAVNQGGRAQITYQLVVQASEATPPRSERSSKIECNTFPSQQARRCESHGSRRRIRKLWVYNRNKNTCTKSFFRDCRAVTNKVSLFPTREQCQNTCVQDTCQLQPRRGPCQQFQQRFYYDARSGLCKQFVYSGCQGNSNNFPNVYACRERCRPRPGNLTTVPTIVPPRLRCPICPLQEARAVCNSEFVLTGIVTHLRREERNARNGGKAKSIMHFRILEVLQDRSQSLNLKSLNLNNLQEAKLELNLDLDYECPCPDVRRLRSTFRGANPSTSRRQTEGRLETKAIIAGTTVNGVPTIDSNGYAARYFGNNFARISSAVKMGEQLCNIMRVVDEEHLT